MTRFKTIVAMAAATLIIAALPALAEEGEDEESEAIGGNSPLVLLLSEEFGMTEDEIVALGDQGLGFGEIFKLKTLAIVLGVDIQTLLDEAEVDPETGEPIFDWGQLKKELTEEQLALLDTLPRNFGAIVSAYNKAKHGDEHGKPEWAGQGKPEHAGTGHGPNGGGDEGDEGDEGGEGGEEGGEG